MALRAPISVKIRNGFFDIFFVRVRRYTIKRITKAATPRYATLIPAIDPNSEFWTSAHPGPVVQMPVILCW